MPALRVHLFGAVLAYDYLLAGWLRESGVDAHYFYNFKHAEQDYPWWEDTAYDRDAPPAWCHFYPFRLPYLFGSRLPAAGRAFVRQFNAKADVQLLIGDGLFLAHHFTRPFNVWSCGYEVEWAAEGTIDWRGLVSRLTGGTGEVRLQRRLNRAHVRRQLRRAYRLMIPMDFQLESYLRWVGPTAPAVPVPMLYDCDRYRHSPHAELEARYRDEEAVFLLFTRHSYGSGTTNDKGADKVIRAFREVLNVIRKPVRLVMVRKGERLADSESLVSELGLIRQVDWIDQVPKDELKRWYSLSNAVVLDQFPNETSLAPALHDALRRRGGRGSIFAEAMSIGRPVISNVGSEWIREFRPPMVWNACSEREIASAMHEALRAREQWEQGGRANRAWAYRHLHWKNQITPYVELLEAAAATGQPAR